MKCLPVKNTVIDNVGGYRLVKSAVVRSSKGEKVFLNTNVSQETTGQKCFSTDIFDENHTQVGYNSFNINLVSKTLNGYFIKVTNAADRQKHGYGEIMRLASIIDMLENNLRSISILSKTEAIMFHYKYGFKPQVDGYGEVMEILHNICKDKTPELKEIRENAGALLDETFSGGLWFGLDFSFVKKGVDVVENYLAVAKEKHLKWNSDRYSRGVNFNKDIDMRLFAESVRKNKDFYNDLFEKHDFDYRI